MKNMSIYQKSLGLLDEFLAETSQTELSSLISKHKNLGIEGPTLSEYLNGVQNEFESIDWHSDVDELVTIDLSDCYIYKLDDDKSYYIPPPMSKKYNSNKKDSSNIEESFFLV